MNNPTTVVTVRLNNFRNYVALDADLGPSLNLLSGENAQGKTNLLEALYLLSTARLLRGQRDGEAIREGAGMGRVEADLGPLDTSVAVQLQAGARKRSFLNGYALPRASDILGRLPAVCISAEDLSLTRGEPAHRRLFLDLELAALYPAYLRDLGVYKRALEQRNVLLRLAAESFVAEATFEPWEAQLGLHGANLRASRASYVERLHELSRHLHEELAFGEGLAVSYVARDDGATADDLVVALAARRGDDIRRGSTSIGPHRDELTISTGGRDVRLFGSQGQQRSTTISIKLGALKLAEAERGSPPLLLLDDVFSDLDAGRRGALIDLILASAGQVVLTCTEASAAGPRILGRARMFTVHGGTVNQQ
ncbi:MAG: DNA replication/repair protein RecF [Fimbriimonadaceae bacterium]